MGKGSRNRQVHAEDKVNNPQKYVKKKQAPKWLGSVITAVIAVAIVCAITISALVTNGVFMRSRTAMKSDDFKVNGAVMSYYMHSSVNSFVSYYENYYNQLFGNSGYDISGSIYSLLGLDPSRSFKKQVKEAETGLTWFDYFANMAKEDVEELLVYCQAAKEAGVELDEDDLSAIDSNIELLKVYASYYGMTFTNYLARTYGKGILERDVRNALKLSQLASKYRQKLSDGFYDAASADSVQKFYEDNKNDYNSVDYLTYVFKATKASVKDDATEEEKTAAAENYATFKEDVNKVVAELETKTTAEDFKAYAKEAWMKENAEDYKTKYFDGYLAEAEGETLEVREAAAQAKVDEKLAEDADKVIANMLVEKHPYGDTTDADKWLFGTERTGNFHKVVDDSKDSEGTYTVTVYFLLREPGRDETLTRNIGLLILKSGDYTETEAGGAKALFGVGEKTKDEFLKLKDTYDKATNCTTYDNLKEGELGLEEVDEWLYDSERAAGDYEMIKCTYDGTTYYALVFVESMGDAYWYTDCEDNMVTKNMADWLEEAEKTYPVVINDSAINKIGM